MPMLLQPKKAKTLLATLFVLVVLLGTTQLWIDRKQLDQGFGRDSVNVTNNPTEVVADLTQKTIETTVTEDREEDFVTFRDIEVSWRDREMPSGVAPPYGAKYESFRSKALAGDAEAAFALYYMLDECKSAFETENEKTAAINEFRQTHLLQLPEWQKPLRMRNAEDLELMVGQIETSFEKCYPISSKEKAEKHRWLEAAAADGGSAHAAAWFASIVSDPEKSMNAALTAWNGGAAQGLLVMQKRYQESYENGNDVRGNIKAFSALYTYAYLLSESRSSLSDPRVGEAMKSLEAARASLHEYQVQEAIDMAVDAIESNSGCCIRF